MKIEENIIVSCETAGIRCWGARAHPLIRANNIRFCRTSAIVAVENVQADIIGNDLSINDVGIEIDGNDSNIIDNSIEKSNKNGIWIRSRQGGRACQPKVFMNKIYNCGYNGILVTGELCNPEIKGNYIESNRKAGIKLFENA